MINETAFRQIQRRALIQHFDANETLHLERELIQLRAKLYEVQFPATMARNFAPKATDIASSVETFAYKVYEPVGRAKLIAYKGGDIPRVDVIAKEVTGKVRPLAASYGWDINELRESARLGLQLSTVKSRACRDAIERGIDTLLAFGAIPDEAGVLPDVGLQGLANNPLVVALTVIAGGWWLNPTPLSPDVVLADLNELVSTIVNFSSNTFTADTLLLPTTHYSYIQQTPFSSLSGDSILTVFRRNNPQITTIAPWWQLNTAGDSNKPRAIAYQKDPMVLEAVIPQEFEVMPPEMQGLEFIFNAHARCGGVKIYQPLAVRYMDFATA